MTTVTTKIAEALHETAHVKLLAKLLIILEAKSFSLVLAMEWKWQMLKI